ncbi:MAG: polyhydroxyalkanoate synthesis regulator DNA-binding domain-containing protein [Acidobacteriota bacterium]
MIRVIKRYESRKLYDTEESRYISLEDIAKWVRTGQDVRVIDNATSEDVTPQVLTQIILDEGKRGTSFLPTELLHELVRVGEKALVSGVEQVQGKVDRFVKRSIDRFAPVRQAREEMALLRDRLGQLESTLSNLDIPEEEEAPAPPRRKTSTTRKTSTARKTTAASRKRTTAAKKAAAADDAEEAAPAPKKTTRRRTTKKTTTTAAASDDNS